MSRAMMVLATAADGTRSRWRVWYEPRVTRVGLPGGRRLIVPCWMIETDDGCVRGLEETWRDSVPLIRQIAENYGVEVRVD